MPTSARILIVEDDAQVLALLRRYLERAGYAVATATSAEEALAVFRSAPDQFDLVVSDLSLPDLAGDKLLERIRQLAPMIPALISSGYDFQPKTARTGFLQKPFLPQKLLAAVEAILKAR
jgi:CheY-like chemotaxis protein